MRLCGQKVAKQPVPNTGCLHRRKPYLTTACRIPGDVSCQQEKDMKVGNLTCGLLPHSCGSSKPAQGIPGHLKQYGETLSKKKNKQTQNVIYAVEWKVFIL